MKSLNYKFEYSIYDSVNELDNIRKKLIETAIEAAQKAYAPYSDFRVGAAVWLENDEILIGNNQENASYPVGICAERTLLSYAHANFPDLKKKILAIAAIDTDHLVSPCGLCRQSILEYEKIQNQPIEIILSNRKRSVWVIPSASVLLPLHFDNDSLRG